MHPAIVCGCLCFGGNAVATYADGLLRLDGIVRVFEPHEVLFAGTRAGDREREMWEEVTVDLRFEIREK